MVTQPGEIESDTLEHIVREVTRRLRATPMIPSVAVDLASSRQDGERGTASAVPAAKGVVKLAAAVVTLAEVAGQLEGAREVVIGPRTILTPAVRDVLTQRRIAVTRSVSEATVPTAQMPRLVVGITPTGHDPQPYWRQFERLGVGCRRVDGSDLAGILQELTTLLAGAAHQAVLLTDQSAAALCLANRQPGIRAIFATGVDAVGRDTQAVGANLLVVSPRGLSAYQVGCMAREFCHQGALPCPEKYQAWLA